MTFNIRYYTYKKKLNMCIIKNNDYILVTLSQKFPLISSSKNLSIVVVSWRNITIFIIVWIFDFFLVNLLL